MKENIKKYHIKKEQAQIPEFGMYHFTELENKDLCLSEQPHSHSFYQVIWFQSAQGIHI